MTQSLRLSVLTTALGELGVTETKGHHHTERILEYFGATTLATRPAGKRDETPWCSAFVCWVAEQCGAVHPGSAWARSWLGVGVSPPSPVTGVFAVFGRGVRRGHVGLWLGARDSWIHVLGGNQSGLPWTKTGAVCVKRYPAERLLGIRRFAPVEILA